MASITPKTTCVLPVPNLKHRNTDWDSIFKHFVKFKNDEAILRSYIEMESSGISATKSSIPIILKACTKQCDIELGRKIHSRIAGTNLMKEVKINTALVDFYCKCGLLESAQEIFDKMNRRDLISWNTMIWGCIDNYHHEDALKLFLLMEREMLKPSSVTLVALISACTEALYFRPGQEIHGYCLRNGFFNSDVHVGTSLIGFYSKFSITSAFSVFDLMAVKNIASWNAMLGCFLSWGSILDALDIFVKILEGGVVPDLVTLLGAIQAGSEFGSAELGEQIHQVSIKCGYSSDAFIGNALVNMYGRCNLLRQSCILFEKMVRKDLASWNVMMSVYRDLDCYYNVIDLFNRMRLEGIMCNAITICTLLSACAKGNDLESGMQLHAMSIKSGLIDDTSVRNALLGIYVDLNLINHAQFIFSELPKMDVLSWNTMITGLIRCKLQPQAYSLFRDMQHSRVKPNEFTMVSLLSGCKCEASVLLGKSIHCYIIRHGIELNSALSTALTDMYMNCRDETAASYVFWNSHGDLVSWNAMISSKVRNGEPNQALWLLKEMQFEMEPNSVTIIGALHSCGDMANLPLAKSLHGYIIRKDIDLVIDASVGNALVTMYAKCGSVNHAQFLFERLPSRDIVTWNSMIAAFGMHGRGNNALHLFRRMLEVGLKPTNITFVSILSACSHSGLIEEGLYLFQHMLSNYGIVPETVHYACMVDLLGRAGQLDAATELIASMPMEADTSVWRALLSACRVHANIELARVVAEKLIELEPENIGNYVLLSNIHAAAGNWADVKKLRIHTTEKNLKKSPGKSWIALKSQIHSFTAGDRSHPQTKMIYAKLNWLLDGIGKNGYTPDSSWVLHDIEDSEKELKLFSHSEKLAISFALLNDHTGAPIIVNKNLRVCGDCHEFCKHVSKYVGREIILRDNSRFHHFSDSLCSCGDYW